jgi:predicted HAD superfamily Cof-like phosphohydrolase
MTPEQKKVLEFHQKFFMTISKFPSVTEAENRNLRVKLIQEELGEYKVAAFNHDIEEIADALGDLLYVVYGAAVSHGIDLEPVFNEIHRSNMTKLREDGTIIYNELGKVMKPETYSPADLEPIIIMQTIEGNGF